MPFSLYNPGKTVFIVDIHEVKNSVPSKYSKCVKNNRLFACIRNFGVLILTL